MLKALARARIHEAMQIDTAATCVCCCEYRKALEAEPSPTVKAHHLVAFHTLCILCVEILLRNSHATCWTLLRASLVHPLFEAVILRALPARSQLLLVFLTSATCVKGLNTTPQARRLLANVALKSRGCIIAFHSYPHWAVWGRASTQISSA